MTSQASASSRIVVPRRAQAGRERRSLLRPHTHDRGRSDHEDRAAPHLRRAQGRDRRQDLHGLAQAHVVGQDPTQSGG